MLNIGTDFRECLRNDDRRYIEKAIITARDANDQTITLTLRENEIWSDGFSVESAASSDGNFDIGAAIIGKATLVINNISGDYTDINFTEATVVLKIGPASIGYDDDQGVEHDRDWHQKGVYTVDEATYSGEIITLSCLDNMYKFDKSYSSVNTTYRTTLYQIVKDICTPATGGVNVTLATNNFPHYNKWVERRPDDDALTCREMISYVAQIAGCFAWCDSNGHLRIEDYNFERLNTVEIDHEQYPVVTDNNNVHIGQEGFDPNNYNPWNQRCHLITGTYSSTIGVDDVVITGIAVTGEIDGEEVTRTSGSAGYVLEIKDNPLIQSDDLTDTSKITLQNVANWVGLPDDSNDTHYLIGRRFRVASLSHLSDPSIEPGDVAYVRTRKGAYHPIIISSTTFTPHSAQSTRSSARTPARNSATRYSAETQTYIALRKLIEHEVSEREAAIRDLNNRLVVMPTGAYTTTVELQSGGSIYYIHDQANLEDSTIVWKITADGWGVATGEDVDITKSGTTYIDNSTYSSGMNALGDAILSIVYATGIVADYIHLYGNMTVYKDDSSFDVANSGGIIGYGQGQSDWGGTNGIHLLSNNSKAEVIATTAGARISYFDEVGEPSNAVMALDTGTQMHTKRAINNTTTYHSYVTTFAKTENNTTVVGSTMSAGSLDTTEGESLVNCDTNGDVYLKRSYLYHGIVDIVRDYRVGVEDGVAYLRGGTILSDYSFGVTDYVEINSRGIYISTGTKYIELDTSNDVLKMFNMYAGITVYRENIHQDYYTMSFRAGNETNYLDIYWTYNGWVGGSDRELKKDIDYNIDGDLIDKLKPVSFKYKSGNKTKYGFIAQDVQKVIPEIVEKMPNSEYLGLDYNDFSALLVAKVQKQQRIMEEQQETIEKQSKKIEELESRLTKIEELLNTTK